MERLTAIGKIQPKKSVDIKKSRIGLGFEKLDRDVFDPNKAYDRVAESGVKWARLQSGWQRTERERGVYDFEWLDSIVDKMISIGVEPWLCLCYGNELYTEEAKQYFGAVGIPPIKTEEERAAWDRYVRATVAHYEGRIHYYEVWNEPDNLACWKYGPDPVALAEFTKATAIACKETDPTCEVIGLTLCSKEEFAREFAATGVLDYLDGLSYHAYTVYDRDWIGRHQCFEELRAQYKPSLKLFQGESGTQSRSDGCGALRRLAWTPLKQAKYLLRHLLTDLGNGVEFASYFSCMDMIEALRGKVGDVSSYLDYGYFGVLGADFDEEGHSVGSYTPKPSYYALQNLCSLMCEDYELAPPPEGIRLETIRLRELEYDFNEAFSYAFKRENGAYAVAYWAPRHILTETFESTVSLKLSEELRGKEIRLYDLLNGTIYHLSDEMTEEQGILKNIPVSDSPMLLTFGDGEV